MLAVNLRRSSEQVIDVDEIENFLKSLSILCGPYINAYNQLRRMIIFCLRAKMRYSNLKQSNIKITAIVPTLQKNHAYPPHYIRSFHLHEFFKPFKLLF